jgi:hypothetical protein
MRCQSRNNKTPAGESFGDFAAGQGQPNVRELLRVNELLNCTSNLRPRLQSSAHLHDAGGDQSQDCDELKRRLQAARDEMMLGGNRNEIISRIHEIEQAMTVKGCK